MQTATMALMLEALRTVQDAANAIEHDTITAIEGDKESLIKHFVEVREVNEAVKLARDLLKGIEDRLSYSHIPDALRRDKVKFIFIEDIGRVSIGHRWSASIIDGQKPAAWDWLKSTGNGSLIIETVNSSTLAGFAKNRVETEGKDLPPDIFKVSVNPYTSITKG